MNGVTIILMKGYNGKSRLALNQNHHRKLIDALAFDLYNSITETSIKNNVWDCFIASPDQRFSKKCKERNISVLDLCPGELNLIFQQIQQWTVEQGYDALILCSGDIPLLQGTLIDSIKRKLMTGHKTRGKSMIICPSKKNGVSIIAMTPANLWRITSKKGIANLNVIKGLDKKVFPYEILKDSRAYLDLDHYEDLSSALQYMEKYSMYENKSVRTIVHDILTSD